MRSACLVLAAALALPASAHAQIFLSGVVGWGADVNGDSITEPGEFDNIVGTGNAAVTINNSPHGTTFALPIGVHAFTFIRMGREYNALSLYFADNGNAFNRPFGSAPDLAVFGVTAPNIPAAGARVQTNGQFSGTIAYSGATQFSSGGLTARVTAFTASNGSGTFEITVVPAPAGLAAMGLAGLALSRRRR
jgi:uncharacterized protein (TIGR03382 family)